MTRNVVAWNGISLYNTAETVYPSWNPFTKKWYYTYWYLVTAPNIVDRVDELA